VDELDRSRFVTVALLFPFSLAFFAADATELACTAAGFGVGVGVVDVLTLALLVFFFCSR